MQKTPKENAMNTQIKLLNPRAPTLLAAALSLAILQTAFAATDTWTGGGAPNGDWSNGGNWLAGTPPSPFDSLVFTNQTGVPDSATNDFAAGTGFDGITFSSSAAGSPFTVSGNAILLSGNTNGITTGVNNTTSLGETVNNNLTLDWGYHTFYSPAAGSSLNLNGAILANLAGVADFQSNNVNSTSYALDGTGLIGGLGAAGLIGNNGLGSANSGGGFSALATVNNGVLTNYTYTAGSILAAGGAFGATTPGGATNLEITVTSSANFTLAGGNSSTYGTSQTFINSVLMTINTTTKNTGINIPDGNGTLVLGTTNLGAGMYVGGIFVPGAQTAQEITIGSGASTFLTSGPMSGNPVPGEIIFAINGDNTSNEGEVDCAIKDNLSGGKVTVVYAGAGSMYINSISPGSTYSGGTYIDKGRIQWNYAYAMGSGPVYVEGGNAEVTLQNAGAPTITNNFFLAQGCSSLGAPTEGALRLSGTSDTMIGAITLWGPPITPGATAGTTPATIGNRISVGSSLTNNLAGQITGPGTFEYYANTATGTLVLSNTTASPNNWTGGFIIDSGANDNSIVRLWANNQLGNNNLTLIQSGTGYARLDLNGFTDTIGGLSSGASALDEVANSGSTPSVLTIGSGNASATFGGIIGFDNIPNTLSIVKIGTGTEILNNANSYQGNTLVEGGTLALSGSGSLSTPSILVSNATFDISAANSYVGSGSIALTSNGVFNVATIQATVGGNFALSNSTVVFSLNESAPSVVVSGTLATGGATNSINLTSMPGFGSYPQQFPLIKYGSADPNLVDGNNNLMALTVTLPSGSFVGYLTNNTANNSIDLVLASGPIIPVEPVTWSGETNGVKIGNWDTLTTSNWVLTADGVTPYFYEDTAPVVFDDTVRGTTAVVLKQALYPGSINLNNNNSNYVFSGTGKISGMTGLTNNGAGTLTLAETGGDNYSGGITVNNGTVILDNNSGNVSGGTTINAGTLQLGNNDTNGILPSGTLTVNGALVFDRIDTALSVANITGTGAIMNSGSGTVTLTGTDPFTGSVTVNAGTLALNGPNGTTSTISTSTNLTINTNGTVMLEADNSLGNTTTALPIFINAGGVLTGLATADGGTGTSSHLRGLLTLFGGALAMNGSQTATHGSWDLDGGLSVPGVPFTSTITALNVVPSEIGGTLFNVVSGGTPSGIDLLVSGTLNNASAQADTGVIKEGNGLMVLDNNNSYSHNTTVNNGILQLGLPGDLAALVSPLGTPGATNTVTVISNSVLKFASSKGVTVGNPIADDGTATVLSSSGTNILSAVNTYTGDTIVTAGKLALAGAGSINGSTNIIVSNAIFDISGAASALDDGGNLSLTNSDFNLGGDLATEGNLSVTNSVMTFAVSQNSSTNIVVTNLFASGGVTNVVVLTSVPGYQYYPTNLPLIQYGSFANVNGANQLTNLGLVLPALGSPAGYLTNNTVNNTIDLVLESDTLIPLYSLLWVGLSNSVPTSTWDILATPDWLGFGINGNVPNYVFQNNSAVAFDDSSATQTVNLTTSLLPTVLVFSNNVRNYTLIGTGAIAGAASIMKVGTAGLTLAETGGDTFSNGVYDLAGALVLSNANTSISGGLTVAYGASLTDQHSGTIAGGLTNGGTVLLDQSGILAGNGISSGSVQVGNNDALGSLPTGTFENDGALVFNRSDAALGVGTIITGGGVITNAGTGTVTLNATEPFGGTVVANAGSLVMNAGNNAAPNGISAANQLIINSGATVAVLVDNSLAGHGAAEGTLPIFINAGGQLTGAPGADGGAGTSSHLPGVVTLNGGTLANSGTSLNGANGSWDLDDGVATAGGSVTSMMTALDMVASAPGGTTFDVIAGTTPSGIDLEVTGSIIHATAQPDTGVIQNGNGTMVFDNNNTYTNNTTVNGGTLQLGLPTDTNAINEPLGAASGVVTLSAAGATLHFASHIGVTVSNVISDDNLGDALVLVSSGTNILWAANTYTAPTIISNGTLLVNGSLSSASSVTVVNGTLGGSGSVGGAVTNSGTIAPGTSTTTATFTCSSNVWNTGAATSLMKLNTAGVPSNDQLAVAGTLNYGGTLKVISLGGTYTAGEVFQLFTAGAFSGSFSATNLAPPAPGYGLTWNPANGTVTVIQTVNTNPTNITTALTGNTLTLSWPADHTGWRLLAQTNTLANGLNPNPAAWSTVPGSASTNSESITMDPRQATVFYRLVFP